MSVVDAMLSFARQQLGKPYVFGATGPSAYDCSGLTEKAAAAAGISIPRTSQEQRNFGVGVPLSDVQPGDLITFTYNDGASNPGPGNHVAIYWGAGHVIEAARPGVPVRIAPLDTAHVDRVRRITGGATGSALPVDNVTSGGGGVQQAGLQQAGYQAVVNLTPWGIPLNPFKLPGYVAGKVGGGIAGAEGDVQGLAGAGVSAAWDTLGPIVLATIAVGAGLALAVLGVYVTAKPSVDEQEDKLVQAVGLAV